MNWIIRFFSIIFAVFALSAITSCKDDSGKNEPQIPEAERTVLVYMVATNNLGSQGYDDDDIEEMLAGIRSADTGDFRWLVYQAKSDHSDPELFELTKGIKQPLRTYTDGRASVEGARMDQVLTDVATLAPAKSYGLVLWSHASGWLEDGIDDSFAAEPGISTLSFGSDFGSKMNVTTLARVLGRHNFEYVYFDACYMATVEVAYELRHAVKYIVGSPSELPAAGMPYDQNVSALIAAAPDGLVQAATNTFNYYNGQKAPDDRTCTISVIRTSALDGLAVATRDIYAATPLPHPGTKVTNYRGYSRQGYSIDFGEYVDALAADATVSSTAFDKALADAVLYSAGTDYIWDSYPVYRCSGLATYVFNRADDYDLKGYPTLQWAGDVVETHVNHNKQ